MEAHIYLAAITNSITVKGKCGIVSKERKRYGKRIYFPVLPPNLTAMVVNCLEIEMGLINI